MDSTEKSLIDLGWEVNEGIDDCSFKVISPIGNRFNFWPHSGWYAGPTQGRGFDNLLKSGKQENKKDSFKCLDCRAKLGSGKPGYQIKHGWLCLDCKHKRDHQFELHN